MKAGMVVACLILTALAMPGCIPGESKLPTATATLHGAKIDLPRGSYCWSEGGRGTCADSAGVDQLLQSGYLKPYRTAGGFDAKIEFQPDTAAQSFEVRLERSPSGPRPVQSQSQTFAVDVATQGGIYVYGISARWPQGDVSFFLPLEVVPGAA